MYRIQDIHLLYNVVTLMKKFTLEPICYLKFTGFCWTLKIILEKTQTFHKKLFPIKLKQKKKTKKKKKKEGLSMVTEDQNV